MGCCGGGGMSPGVMGASVVACPANSSRPTGYVRKGQTEVETGTYRVVYESLHGRCVSVGSVLNSDGLVVLPTPRIVPLPA